MKHLWVSLVVEYVYTIEVVLFYGLQIVDWFKSIEERLSPSYLINLRERSSCNKDIIVNHCNFCVWESVQKDL